MDRGQQQVYLSVLGAQPTQVVVEIGGEEKKSLLPLKIAFVIDCSGSMFGDKIEKVKTALNKIYEAIKPDDAFTIVMFGSSTKVVQKWIPKKKMTPQEWQLKISSLTASMGSTALYDAVAQTLAEFRKKKSFKKQTQKEMIVLTDGEDTSSTQTDTKQLRQDLSEPGVPHFHLSLIGVGLKESKAKDVLCGTSKHCKFWDCDQGNIDSVFWRTWEKIASRRNKLTIRINQGKTSKRGGKTSNRGGKTSNRGGKTSNRGGTQPVYGQTTSTSPPTTGGYTQPYSPPQSTGQPVTLRCNCGNVFLAPPGTPPGVAFQCPKCQVVVYS